MTNFKWPNEPLISFCRLAPPTVVPVLENGAMIYSVVEVKDSKASLTYLYPHTSTWSALLPKHILNSVTYLCLPTSPLSMPLSSPSWTTSYRPLPVFPASVLSTFDSFLIQKPKWPFKNINQIILFLCLKPINGWLSLVYPINVACVNELLPEKPQSCGISKSVFKTCLMLRITWRELVKKLDSQATICRF